MSVDNRWFMPDGDLFIEKGEAHVWRGRLDRSQQFIQDIGGALSDDERKRAARFYFQKDRERFIVGRGMLRAVLGRYLNIQPAVLRFSYNQYGKPFLIEGAVRHELRFNLSHSDEFALLGLTFEGEIGVDIERVHALEEIKEIAGRFFSPAEAAALMSLPPDQQIEAFFNCWTLKEAFLKARGEGLSGHLAEFDVAFIPGERPALLRAGWDPEEARRWSLYSLEVVTGYRAALAVRATRVTIKRLGWEERPQENSPPG